MNEVAVPAMVRFSLCRDAQFLVAAGDSYWSGDVANAKYEPEIHWLLGRAAARPFAMLDAGANYGYWSVLASSPTFGGHPTVAIEPAKANFEWLCRNARANGDRFQTLRRACFDVTGKQMALYGKKHYGLSLRTDWHAGDVDQSELVETITLDDVAERYVPHRQHPALIKLDVEGSEVAALRGAQRLIDEGALIIYEDHGKEPTHPTSQFVLALDGIRVWHVDGERPRAIARAAQVGAIKTDPLAGYNFFACRCSSPWSQLFEDSPSWIRRWFAKVH